jgi:type I restriction enzyme, S subunit
MTTAWKCQTLDDACLFSNGLWKGEKPPFVHVGVIRNTNFTKEGTLDDSDIAYLDVEAKKLEKRSLQFGDVILEKSGGGPKQPVGRVILFDKTEGVFSFSNFTAALRVRDPKSLDFRFLHKFLYWTYVSGITEGMQSHSTGIRNLDGDAYKAIKIKFPSLAEQERIVTLLDEAFDGIATARANAEQNLQNARALFESHLQSVFSQRGDGWVEKTLGNAYDVRDGTHDSPKYYDKGFPLITSKNLKRDGLSFDDVKLINDTDYRKINERSAVHKGDVLLAMIGTIGNPVVVELEPEFAIKNVALLKVPSNQSSHFLRYYLSSQFVVNKMQSEAKGTTQKFVGLGYLRAFPIMLPSFTEQINVVRELDDLSAETQRLESIYQRKLAALDALKKSLLHQAFSGAL